MRALELGHLIGFLSVPQSVGLHRAIRLLKARLRGCHEPFPHPGIQGWGATRSLFKLDVHLQMAYFKATLFKWHPETQFEVGHSSSCALR